MNLLMNTMLTSSLSAATFPKYAETFTVETIESDAVNGVVVRQKIVRDVTLHRSMMLARGPLVHGVLQQIMRCDIFPVGWFADIGGADDAHLQCKNATQNPDPAYCQWSPFWEQPPPNASSEGVVLNGTSCTRWIWWHGGEQFAFWGTSTTPLRTAKLFTPHQGWLPWAIDFVNFVAATPPDEAYAPLSGADCPPASAPPYNTDFEGVGERIDIISDKNVGLRGSVVAGHNGEWIHALRSQRLEQRGQSNKQPQQRQQQTDSPPLTSWRLEIDTTVPPVTFFNHTLDACYDSDFVDETLNAFRTANGTIRMIGGNGGVGPCSWVGPSIEKMRRDCANGPVIQSRNDYDGPGDFPHNMWLPGIFF